MRQAARAVLGLLGLGLAAAPLAQQSAGTEPVTEVPEAVEEILSSPVDEAYVETPRCIPSNRIRDVNVIDGQHIAFQMGRDSYYLVQFERRCPQLRRNSTIVHDARGNRLCRLDMIRPVDGFGSTSRLGPPCQIPGFQAINHEQLMLLREQLKNKRTGDLIDELPETDGDSEPTAEPS